MKRLLLYVLVWVLSFAASAQTITAYRYWYDNSFTNAATVNGSFGSDYSLDNQFTVSELSDGLHSFNIAFKASTSKWSSTSSSFFYKQTSLATAGQSQYQYWFDNDFSNALTNSITFTSDFYLLADLDVNSLSNGLHSLNIRFRPDGGAWSVITSSFFYKSSGSSNSNITNYQYWFDNNVQDSVTTTVTPASNFDFTTDVNTVNLTNGLHVFNVRFKQENGLWSAVKSDFFNNSSLTTLNNKIKTYRYWFDQSWQQYKEISIGSLPVNDFTANVDVESLSEGLHTLSSIFKDANGLWSSPVTSFFTRGEIITKEYLYPKIYLSKASIQAGQKDSITGKDFQQNGEVKLSVTKTGTTNVLLDTIIGADKDGKVKFELTTSVTTTPGIYTITAFDNNILRSAYSSRLEIKSNAVNQLKYIQFISPEYNNTYSNNIVPVVWTDKSKDDRSKLLGNTAKVPYKYRIEFSKDAGQWTICPDGGNLINGVYEGSSYIDQYITSRIRYDFIPLSSGAYRFKITDLLNPVNYEISTECTVTAQNPEIFVKYLWDKSSPTISKQPIGVVSDGTARLVIKVFKQPNTSKQVATVKLELSDALGSSESRILGRVINALQISSYSTEGNNATATTFSTATTIDPLRNNFYFWYVAPEDFTRTDADKYVGHRQVNLKVTVTYTDNTTTPANYIIEVVRPPVMLVHGIAGDPSTWDSFTFTDQNGDKQYYQLRQDIFKAGIFPLSMSKDECYAINAKKLLNLTLSCDVNSITENNIEDLNSFAYRIQTAKNNGYACSRVDYICHSMGGDMARMAINSFSSVYNPIASSSYKYKNYGKGFINKMISLNSPYNGSPWADVCDDLASRSSSKILKPLIDGIYSTTIGKSFFKPNGYSYISSNAVKNLQSFDGGISFKVTQVKNHVIAGQALTDGCSNSPYIDLALGNINTGFFKKIMEMYAEQTYYKPEWSLCDLSTVVFSHYNEPNFMNENDFVVSLKSQLAGTQRTPSDSKTFYGLGARHAFPINVAGLSLSPSITSNNDVGTYIFSLLNTDINSETFASQLQANPNTSGEVYRQARKEALDSTIEYFNKVKVEIISPSNYSNVPIDSLVEVRISLKDTLNYKYLRLFFQGELYYSESKISDQKFNIQISPTIPGKNILIATAVYDSLGYNVFYSDTINIDCTTQTQLTNFLAEPKEQYLSKNQSSILQYSGLYLNYVTNIPYTDTALHIAVADKSVIQFVDSLKSFKALKDTGSTYAIITYKGLSDTAFFFIGEANESDSIIKSTCPQSATTFFAGVASPDNTYQWQVNKNDGNGYMNITDGTLYSGAASSTLTINVTPTILYGYSYRCLISNAQDSTYSPSNTIKFSITWTGATNSTWENTANWSCLSLPDENTDVIIPSGQPNNPVLSSNASVRSIQLLNGSDLKVTSGYNLLIKGISKKE